MGAEHSTANNRDLARLRAQAVAAYVAEVNGQNNSNNGRDASAAQRQQQHQQRVAAALERRDRYRSAEERQLAGLLREERPRYLTPLSHSLVNSITSRLNPFPAAEYPPQEQQKLPVEWNAAWVALLVRCSAIAPFAPMLEEDPLSTSAFVAFMANAMQSRPPAQQPPPAAAQQQEQDPLFRGRLAPPPPRPAASRGDDDADPARDEESWVVVETSQDKQQERQPLVPVDAPHPLEECGVCMCFSSGPFGSNHCCVCNQTLCTPCLLHLMKPPKFDISNDESIARAVRRKADCVTQISTLIEKYERSKTPPPESGLDELGRSVTDAFDKAASAAKNVSAFFSSIGSNKKSATPPPSPPLRASAAAATSCQQEVDEVLHAAKTIRELVCRPEVLGLFDCPPERVHAPRRGGAAAGNSSSDDDGGAAVRRRDTTGTRGASAVTSHAASISRHEWPIPDSQSYDDCDFDHDGGKYALLDEVSAAVLRNIRLETRGACPFCNTAPTAWFAGRTPRMLLLKSLADQVGTDPRVIELLRQRRQPGTPSCSASSPLSPASGGGDQVWIAPTAAEQAEYELCVALALSAVVEAQLEEHCGPSAAERQKFLDASVAASSAASSPGPSPPAASSGGRRQNSAMVHWAKRCSCCENLNWTEFSCRVCRNRLR